MKSCVLTENFSCDPNRLWLYLSKPTLSGWRSDVTGYEESDDGMNAKVTNPISILPVRKSPGP